MASSAAYNQHDRIAEKALTFFEELLSDYPRDFAVRLWDGSRLDPQPGQPTRCTLIINRPGALRRLFQPANHASLGEAYIYGDVDIEGDVEALFPLVPYLLNLKIGKARQLRLAALLWGMPSSPTRRLGRAPVKLEGELHSRQRDLQAVTYHYNVSNDFFRLFLDRRMVYSCAYFESPDLKLDEAQEHKLDYICRKLRLKPREQLLDIGCGWGALIMHAAEHYGVRALGITLSEPQAELANQLIREAGLQDLCRVEVRDYRELDEPESFDKLVSVGMIEHVGETMLPTYFEQAFQLLKPGGVFMNHGIARAVWTETRERPTFIDRYVFPDGDMVPIGIVLRQAALCGFEIRDVENLREHYTLTLRHWVKNLEDRASRARQITDESTYRTWRLYMAGSAYFFDTGRLNLYQTVLAKPRKGKSGLPLTRADWYS
jgi:cyclopropane-fatty-acyl-phospholipid synthase